MQKNITGSLDDVVMQLFKCHLKKTEGPVVVLLCTSKRCDMFANKIEELLSKCVRTKGTNMFSARRDGRDTLWSINTNMLSDAQGYVYEDGVILSGSMPNCIARIAVDWSRLETRTGVLRGLKTVMVYATVFFLFLFIISLLVEKIL